MDLSHVVEHAPKRSQESLRGEILSGGVQVRFHVRFHVRFPAVKVPISVDSQLRTQLTKQPPQSSSKGNFFVEYGLEGFRL